MIMTTINLLSTFSVHLSLLLALCSLHPSLSWAVMLEEKNHTIPLRIVSLGPINTENIYLLGAQDRLVGNTSYCVRPVAANDKEKIGSVMQVRLEKIISLKPDLVLATGLTRDKQLKQLQRLGLRVVQFKQPSSFAEICEQFLKLGHLLGLEKRAREIIDHVQGRVQSIALRYQQHRAQKVFLQIGSRPLFSSVQSSFTSDYIFYSNGINIAGRRNNGSMNSEQVLAEDPDVIIIAIMGSETGVARVERNKWQRFSELKAVKQDRVHVINPDLVCSPSPLTFVEALEQIAILVHPEG